MTVQKKQRSEAGCSRLEGKQIPHPLRGFGMTTAQPLALPTELKAGFFSGLSEWRTHVTRVCGLGHRRAMQGSVNRSYPLPTITAK
jgi:hypothetical protein